MKKGPHLLAALRGRSSYSVGRMTHFAVVLADGESLGAIKLGRTDWPAASVIWRGGDKSNLRVVDVIPSDDPQLFDVLVVEPV